MLGPGPPFPEVPHTSMSSLQGIDQKRAKVCGNCGTTSTTQWRHVGDHVLCNKCGLYFNRNQRHRPDVLDNPATPSMGKVSNVRRKQLEIGLQHHAKRQEEQERYHQALGAIGHLDLDRFPNVPHLQRMMEEFHAQQQHQHQQPQHVSPATAPLFYRGPEHLHTACGALNPPLAMAQELQQRLDCAREVLGQLQGSHTAAGPAPPDLSACGSPDRSDITSPAFSPHPLSSVLQKQLDIQLQHAPARQLTEMEWHRRAASVSQLPLQAYLPYIGEPNFLAHPWGQPSCVPPLPAGQEAEPELFRLMRTGLTGRAAHAFCSPAGVLPTSPPRPPSPQMQELEATARQSLTRKHRHLFEVSSQAAADLNQRRTSRRAQTPTPPEPQWSSGSAGQAESLWMDTCMELNSPRSSDSLFDSAPSSPRAQAAEAQHQGVLDASGFPPVEFYGSLPCWGSAGGSMLLDSDIHETDGWGLLGSM